MSFNNLQFLSVDLNYTCSIFIFSIVNKNLLIAFGKNSVQVH